MQHADPDQVALALLGPDQPGHRAVYAALIRTGDVVSRGTGHRRADLTVDFDA